nr:immunoglobulin light chain junction region [Macaca mulatta]
DYYCQVWALTSEHHVFF